MPPYPGVSQVMEVTQEQIEGTLTAAVTENGAYNKVNSVEVDSSWREEYALYLSEQFEEELRKSADVSSSSSAADGGVAATPTVKGEHREERHAESAEDSWESQYGKHCAEKEAQLAKEDARYREALRRQE